MGYEAIMESKIGQSTTSPDDTCEWPLNDSTTDTSFENYEEEVGSVCAEAIIHGTSDYVVEYLLNQMEDPKSYRNEGTGETLLHFAACNTNWRVLEEVLECGVDPNKTDNVGQTPAHLLYRTNATYAIDLLAQHGADFLIKDRKGNTAFSNLLKYKKFRIANHLLNYLAIPLTCIGFTNSSEIFDLIKTTERQRRRTNTSEHKQLTVLLQKQYHFVLQLLSLVDRIGDLENRVEKLCQS